MKYIFTIHSPITYFSACTIIFQEKIQHEDVIIITDGYKVPITIGKVVESYQQNEKSAWQKIKNRNIVKAYDNYIHAITDGKEFIAYVDLMHAYQRIIITNSKCISFNFIEEGLASYVVPDNLFFITNGVNQLGFRNKNFKDYILSFTRVIRGVNIRMLSLPFNPQAYGYIDSVKFYTFSQHGFPGVLNDKKTILNPNTIDAVFFEKFDYNKLDNSIIWIEESFPKAYGLSDENYCNAIQEVIDSLQESKQKIFVKLRPKSEEKKSLLVEMLKKNGLVIEIIPNNILAEILFINCKNLKVIGLVSSLLFYATIFGHKSLSFYTVLKDKPETVFDKIKFYWDVVKSIKVNKSINNDK
ncbi:MULTISPECIES: polysialyltransferase family glycosyltransferase [unclassified Flavobacterium]|uniref:polysialyltransferase family glycosyltransferase n=1 Tax=unclassified Flavobacterium TaxID=196869 RepID=UPI001290A0E1|nr:MULTISPECIES: polysialyltransferase family glycosyltransferase [unclassified Flavobacterium]MQP52066.1 hypothetical protein [Flavobacterium sp. LMO9]MQP61935.1 hypothetical protein [Flavobacterium sp. LMO6]